MFLPEQFNFGELTIPTMWAIAGFGALYWLFILWFEARKDGFDEENFLNMVFVSLIVGGLTFIGINKLYDFLHIYYLDNPILLLDQDIAIVVVPCVASFLPIFYFTKKLKWSKYRIFDIYSLGFALFVTLASIGEYFVYGKYAYLIIAILYTIFYFKIFRYRGYKFESGSLFSIFLFFNSTLGLLFFRKNGYWLFYGLLFTIGLLNLYFRRKKAMYKRNLPAEFIKALKNKLITKEKDTKEQQQNLIKEDPYMQPGRDTGNAESIDEAILEDSTKDLQDVQLGMIKKVRLQVRKALAAMKIGKYGVCEVCGNPIDPARLRVYPEATTCIDCAEKVSRAEDAQS